MKLKVLCIILLITTLAACAWAISAELRCLEYNGRIAELLTSVDEPVAHSAYAPDDAAAEFNGGIVTVSEAAAEYEMLKPYYEMFGMSEAEYAEGAKLDVLDMLIEKKILEIKAREAGVYEMDDAARSEFEGRVQAEYNEMVEYYMPFRFQEGKSEAEVREETIAYLNENGDSFESYLARAEAEAWQDRLFEHVTSGFEVSDEELHVFYDEQLASAEQIYSINYDEYEADCDSGRAVLWHPDGVRRVQRLLIPFSAEHAADYADIQALLAAGDASRLEDLDMLYGSLEPLAQEALDLANSGEDFYSLMESYGGGSAEGECISDRSTLFGDEIRDAAMQLEKIGNISGILRCDEGLCILRYASDVIPGAVPFEEVAEDLRANYTEEMRLSAYNATVMQWINEANIIYHPERF